MVMQIIKLKETESTNDFLLDMADKHPGWEGVATSDFQSCGKGMGSNRWESENGKNLLFSILLHPTWLPVHSQYILSMAEAVAICDVLRRYADGITIKWPNDIYWMDCKLSGTRIDANINGRGISDMIIGTGININQKEFVSDAPNPVSLIQITGTEHDRCCILDEILDSFTHHLGSLREGKHDAIIKKYHDRLYRKEGLYRYRDSDGEFLASIEQVMPDGILKLKTEDGDTKEFMFKEVEFIIEQAGNQACRKSAG